MTSDLELLLLQRANQAMAFKLSAALGALKPFAELYETIWSKRDAKPYAPVTVSVGHGTKTASYGALAFGDFRQASEAVAAIDPGHSAQTQGGAS